MYLITNITESDVNYMLYREYMEECQEQLTELRKQKIELGRERKRM